jgi:hypothetical protein
MIGKHFDQTSGSNRLEKDRFAEFTHFPDATCSKIALEKSKCFHIAFDQRRRLAGGSKAGGRSAPLLAANGLSRYNGLFWGRMYFGNEAS